MYVSLYSDLDSPVHQHRGEAAATDEEAEGRDDRLDAEEAHHRPVEQAARPGRSQRKQHGDQPPKRAQGRGAITTEATAITGPDRDVYPLRRHHERQSQRREHQRRHQLELQP